MMVHMCRTALDTGRLYRPFLPPVATPFSENLEYES